MDHGSCQTADVKTARMYIRYRFYFSSAEVRSLFTVVTLNFSLLISWSHDQFDSASRGASTCGLWKHRSVQAEVAVCSQWQIQWKQKLHPPKRWQFFKVQISRSAWWTYSFIQPKSRFVVSNQDLWLYIFLTLPAGNRQYSYHFWVQVFKLQRISPTFS